MNHAVTLGDLLRALGGIAGGLAILIGALIFMGGAMSDAPQEGNESAEKGCASAVIGLILIILMLAACATAPPVQTKIVEVDKPVAAHPIQPSDIPATPPPLGPRPADARDAADAAFAAHCRDVAFVIRAFPLLLAGAGLPPAQAPAYPECRKH